jgi:hypothetical protein
MSPIGWVLTIAVLGSIVWLAIASVQNARKQKVASAELGRVAKAGLLRLNLSPEDLALDMQRIDTMVSTGSNREDQIVLRNFALHAARHRLIDIEEAAVGAIIARIQNPDKLTDAHIIVYKGIDQAFMETDIFKSGNNGDSVAESLAISDYAMNHIEDGYKILSLINDRKYGTLTEIIDGISMLEDSEPGVLASGTL